MSLLWFCQWLAGTSGSIALHKSMYMYPLVESVHVLANCLFVGLTMMFDLRLLGLSLRKEPASEVQSRILPWMISGFVIMVISKVLLFYAIPVRSYQSIFFRAKVILLLLAKLNVFLFHTRVNRQVTSWDLATVTPRAARFAAVASLVLWASIIVTGRMIAYNWFDCDLQPQSAVINWAAGCVIP